MGIVNRRGGEWGWMPLRCNPTCLSLHFVRGVCGGGSGSRPPEVQYLHLLDHIHPSIRKAISAWLGGGCDWTRLFRQTSPTHSDGYQHVGHTGRIQHLIHPGGDPPAHPLTLHLTLHLNWTPSRCPSVTCAPTVHQTLTIILS